MLEVIFILSLPLVVIALLPFGWLRSPWIYSGLAFMIYVAGAILVGAASLASGMAAGHGSSEKSEWDRMGGMIPLLAWLMIGAMPFLLGLSFRVGKAGKKPSFVAKPVDHPQLKTLRQSMEEKNGQNKPRVASGDKPVDSLRSGDSKPPLPPL